MSRDLFGGGSEKYKNIFKRILSHRAGILGPKLFFLKMGHVGYQNIRGFCVDFKNIKMPTFLAKCT
jgi:hypothetical protein